MFQLASGPLLVSVRAAVEGQSSDLIGTIDALTKAIAVLEKGMTGESFLQNGETVGNLKWLKDETSTDLTALEKNSCWIGRPITRIL